MNNLEWVHTMIIVVTSYLVSKLVIYLVINKKIKKNKKNKKNI